MARELLTLGELPEPSRHPEDSTACRLQEEVDWCSVGRSTVARRSHSHEPQPRQQQDAGIPIVAGNGMFGLYLPHDHGCHR